MSYAWLPGLRESMPYAAEVCARARYSEVLIERLDLN